MITKDEVKKIASLARLELTEQELERHAQTISVVLDYMKILNEVDTTGTMPTSQVTGLIDVVRADKVYDSGHQNQLLEQMPQIESRKLKVPGVFKDL